MEIKSKIDLSKKKSDSKAQNNNNNIPKIIIKKEKSPLNDNNKNKIEAKKVQKNNIISFKKLSIDNNKNNKLKINTEHINTITNTTEILDKKNVLKTEIFNNKLIIIKPKYQQKEKEIENEKEKEVNKKEKDKERINNKENFGTIILQKKMKLFSFVNERNDNNIQNNNNNYTIELKESAYNSISSKNLNHEYNTLKTEIKQDLNKTPQRNLRLSVKASNPEKKFFYKKLKLEINKYNNKYNIETENRNTIKLENKINKNREILFNSKEKNENINSTNKTIIRGNNSNKKAKKEKKDSNSIQKILIKNTNKNKIYNSNKYLTKKIKAINSPNKIENKNKIEINKDKDKSINSKKIISSVKVDINLENTTIDSNVINDKLSDKLFLPSENNLFSKTETKIFSIIKTKKIPEIKTKNKMIEDLKVKIEEINKKESKEKSLENKTINKKNNSEFLSPDKRKEYKSKKLNINNNNLILPLNTIESESFRRNTINKLMANNHYKSLFTEILNESTTKTTKTKKKFKFSERKRNENNDLKKKMTESSANYYDLYKKAFNGISLEQKFCFKPKLNKRYFNRKNNINNFYNDKNSKTYNNNSLFNKMKSSTSFNKKQEENNLQEKLDLSLDINKNDINNRYFEQENIKDEVEYDNNKNLILDLNHFIPIDKNKLLYTFSKPLFGNKDINKPKKNE